MSEKPVVIEAIQFLADGSNYVEICRFLSIQCETALPDRISIFTLEGPMTATRSDWIIRGIKGEFYPCKPDIFEQTYEPAEGEHRQKGGVA